MGLVDITYSARVPSPIEFKALHKAAFGNDPLNPAKPAAHVLENKRAVLCFAYNNERLAGYCVGESALSYKSQWSAKLPKIEGTSHIPFIATHPDYRKMGIGSKMLKLTLQCEKHKGFEYCFGFFKEGASADIVRKLLQKIEVDKRVVNFKNSGDTYALIAGRI